MKTALTVVCLSALAAGTAFGQVVISAKSGVIQYAEGEVRLDGKAVALKFGEYPQMSAKSVLTTADGRAELLLTPGAVLRLGEESEVRLVSSRLSDTRVELVRGAAVVEVVEMLEGNALAITVGQAAVEFEKAGVYHLTTEPARLKVYDGEVSVDQAGQTQKVKKSRMLVLNAVSMPEKFNNKQGDSLVRWAKRRGEYMAMANVSAARLARKGITLGSWAWNPFYGMYTYIPMRARHCFWGYGYWTPESVYMAYQRPTYNSSPSWPSASAPSWNAGGGYHSVGQTSSGASGVASSSATSAASSGSSAPPAPSAPPSGGARR